MQIIEFRYRLLDARFDGQTGQCEWNYKSYQLSQLKYKKELGDRILGGLLDAIHEEIYEHQLMALAIQEPTE